MNQHDWDSLEPEIVVGHPPNIEEIRVVFPLTGYEIFAWVGTIYNPSGNDLTPWLIEHEKVHFRQQTDDSGRPSPEAWWKRYLADPGFRLDEELDAHRVEYRVFCRHFKDRNKRALYLRDIAQRLSSPMYGSIITSREAARRIR